MTRITTRDTCDLSMTLRKRNQGEGLQKADTTLMSKFNRTITMLICRCLKPIRLPILTINLVGINPKRSKTNSNTKGIITNNLFISLFNNKIRTICHMTPNNNTRRLHNHMAVNINHRTNIDDLNFNINNSIL